VNVRPARFLNGTYQGVTGVIEDDVELAEMRVGLPNDLPYLFAMGYAERKGKNRVAESSVSSATSANFRPVAATLSPRLSAASAQMRPKPREAPVMNHVFFMWILMFVTSSELSNSPFR
jgi:hypothetical protein